MKKFVNKSAMFLVPILALLMPLDMYLSSNLKYSNGSNGEYEVWTDIHNGKLKCEVCVYGSSRAWVHIDPAILGDSLNQQVYNFGVDGHNFWLQYLRHLEVIKHIGIPRQIILSIDEFSLQRRNDLYQLDQFLPYMLWDKNIREYTRCYEGFDNVDYYIPLVRYFGRYSAILSAIKNSISPDKEHYRSNGYRAMHKEWDKDLDNARAIMDQFHIDIDSSSVKLFERFLDECNQMNINVTLVNTPEYIEGQQFIDNREEVLAMIRRIAIEHNTLFLDYSNDTLCLTKKYFYNATHLNAEGSRIFTSKLVCDLIKQQELIASKPLPILSSDGALRDE
jgi:hypothetical protein